MLKNFFILLSTTLVLQTTIFAQITTNPYQAGLTFSPIRISLYAGIDNYFKLNSQLPAERWELKATNGTIEFSSFGDIVVRPEIAGRDTMYFYFIADNNQKKLVFMQVLSVNPLPPAKINLGKNNKIVDFETYLLSKKYHLNNEWNAVLDNVLANSDLINNGVIQSNSLNSSLLG